ncbi:MAG: J domain-containing protein, partial [Candidatus Rokuibacteriota bacterium]
MASDIDVPRLLHLLAVHPVLPPAEALPPNDAALQSLVADLARAEGSDHADLLRELGHDRAIPVAEIARRARFLLACLLLPPAGTHYEVLGLSSDASTAEVRKRWAAMIQRYHPDHFGGAPGGGWLDGQARRLIEAYQVLKDPVRREEYDT